MSEYNHNKYYPGDADDPFVIWQAKKIVWHKIHTKPNPAIELGDNVEIWLKQEQLLKNAAFIKKFTQEQIIQLPWVYLAFAQEYPDSYQPIFGKLLPEDYRVSAQVGQWRYFVKLILDLGIADRFNGLKVKTDQLFEKVPGAKIFDTHARAINNFYYSLGENIAILPHYPKEYVEATQIFQTEQRRFLTNLLGAEVVSKLLIAMDTYNCLATYSKKQPVHFKETEEFLKLPIAKSIRVQRLADPTIKPDIEQAIAQFVLDNLFRK